MSAAPGTGTAIPARASIRKAGPTAIPSPRSCCRNGTGRSISPPSPTRCEYLNYVADKFDLRRDMQFRSHVTSPRIGTRRATSWTVTLESGEQASARFLFTAHRHPLGPHAAAPFPGRESFQRPGLSHRRAGRTRRWISPASASASSAPGPPPSRRSRRSPSRPSISPSSSARPNWAAPLHNCQDQQGGDGGDQGPLRRDLRALPRRRRAGSSTRPIRARRWTCRRRNARRSGRSSMREPGFGIWMGNFRDILIDEKANARDQRLHRQEDPPAREGPEGRRQADPEGPRLRHAPRAAGERLFRGLQPRQRPAGGHQRDADRAHHAAGHQDQRARNTSSTS